MAAFAPVVLKDHADADVTFAPRDIVNGVATLVNSTGVPIGDKRLSLAIQNVGNNGRRRVSFKLVLPVVQDVVVAGISKPTVVRTAYADVTLTFDATSSLNERKDLREHLRTLCADASFGSAAIDSLDVPY